jgi:hypothetical protein
MSAIGGAAGKEGLRRGARRDPELYVIHSLPLQKILTSKSGIRY